MALTRNRLIGNLANATDSAASSSFLAKGATEANYQGIAYSDVTGKPTILDSAGITSIIDSAYIQARQSSAVAGLDSAGITSLVDSNYIVARAANSGSGYSRYKYTATAGQTVFQGNDNNFATLSYTSGGIMVFYNGVMLKNTVDWEGTDGSSVTLVEAAAAGANVSIHKWTVAGGGSSSGAVWYGDRGIVAGGKSSGTTVNSIEYFDISAGSGNASDFGDLTVAKYQLSGSASNGIYGVWVGGYSSSITNDIDYVTIATSSNATDWGDLTESRYAIGGISNGTYGLFAGGASNFNTIDYITFATPGNAVDFGDLNTAFQRHAAASDGTYGLVGGGRNDTAVHDGISYVTIGTSGSGTDFGDLTQARNHPTACSDNTRVVFGGGYFTSFLNIMDYVTSATTSNATDFGDLPQNVTEQAATSDGTTGVFTGGRTSGGAPPSAINSISKITIQTTSNATDFGDLLANRYTGGATSGSPS